MLTLQRDRAKEVAITCRMSGSLTQVKGGLKRYAGIAPGDKLVTDIARITSGRNGAQNRRIIQFLGDTSSWRPGLPAA